MKRVVVLMLGMFICAGVQARTFLNPPEILEPGEAGYQSVDTREFQGISSLAVSESGRIWAVWYAGPTPGEDRNNYVVLATSGDDGQTWQEKCIIDPDGSGDVRAFDPEIWIDPEGRLWQFWAQHPASDFFNPHAGVWARTKSDPNREDGEWSEPRRLTEGIMMCKPTVLSSGDWLLPASTWRATDYSARAVASDDNGLCFEVLGACNVPREHRHFDEHMIVERKDGSLWLLARATYGIGESFSLDGGKTWSELQPSDIKHTSARFFIRRLDSGNLLLVKHGPINEKIGRSHLTAFISPDDGESWQGGLLLDERDGVSYPDGQQVADGTIYVTYDYSRTGEQKIYMTTFTEEDVLAGEPVSGKVRRRVLISAGGPEQETAHGIPHEWLEAHNLPTDGSVDLIDLQEKGMTVFEDYIADTDPNDPADIFEATAFTSDGNGIEIYFASSSERVYTLYATEDLLKGDWIAVPQGGRLGRGGFDSLQDNNDPPIGNFYRLEVALP